MTSFVLRTADDEDLGFLAFARHEGEWPSAGPNDCVFMGFPYNPELLDDPRGRFVADHKGREFTAQVSYTDTEMTVIIETDLGWRFELWSSEAREGWSATRGDQTLGGVGAFI